MTMTYEAPTSLDAAVEILAKAAGDCRVLAGGTDLLVRLRSDMIAPDTVLDIKRIAEMREIREEDGGFRIGAGVSGAEMGEHAGLAAAWPGIVEAAGLIGSTQIQGRATMAGNLCNASPAADSVPAMIAAGATVRLAGPDGIRDLPVEEVPVAPGKTALQPGELVASIFLPAPAPRSSDAYMRFIPRTEMDIAVVGVGVAVTLDASGTCTAARVGLGAVAPTVLRVEAAENALIGTPIDDAALDAMAETCRAAASPIDDKRGTAEYRVHMSGVIARRTALKAKARAEGTPS